MLLRRLRIRNVRVLEQVDLAPTPRLNWLVGPNGAGKTSVLEAIYLLSRGRSFRTGGDEALLRRGATAYDVYAEIDDGTGHVRRLGMAREGAQWQLRLDGEACTSVGDLVANCAVVCFEPGSHELLSGPAQVRRRFLDWGVFHVEHAYLDQWRRYQRALKQRNRLVRDGREPAEAEPWNRELRQAADAMDAWRRDYLLEFAVSLGAEVATLAPQLGSLRVNYRRGWPDDVDLADALRASWDRDLARGHTTLGPHRADWRLVFDAAPNHAQLSRGQEKIAALACQLAQAAHYVGRHGHWPILCLDDLASELDAAHLARVLARVRDSGAQAWITGTAEAAAPMAADDALFHVEHGSIARS